MSDLAQLPAHRLMVESRKIRSMSGPVELGSITLIFDSADDCQNWLAALMEFRQGHKTTNQYSEKGPTQ